MLPSRITRAAVAVALAMVASLLLFAPSASAATTGKVRGAINNGNAPALVVKIFTKDWDYLGKHKVRDGIYSLSLRPGTYRLQFVDQRPAYNLKKFAPADAVVRVRVGTTVAKNVRMHRGAALYGVARAGGKVAPGAKVVAANTYNQSYEVVANKKGQFAIGGLPGSKYSVFTYDRKKKYVGKSVWVGKLALGKAKKVNPSLRVRSGRLLVDLYAGSSPLKKRVNVTVTSLSNHQWWSANSSGGSVTFAGLYPGRYRISVPGVGSYLASTGKVSGATVRSGGVAFGSYRLTKRGATVSGNVVDATDTTYPLEGAQVLLFDKAGTKVGTTTTDSSGQFFFQGQLTTQGGMTIVAQTGQYSPYLGKGTHYCKYGTTTSGAFSITTSRNAALGAVALPRLPAEQQDDPIVCGS